ncbi:MAG: hypothetical protein DLM69_07525 [Candidatus Chloroheliales bacterium]|nr:MAG: hypothetical protein DLM69_07525 [Chloroflexota bacterium]
MTRFSYHPDTDALYIHLSEKPSADSDEVAPGVVFDYDANGKLVGIDIDHLSAVADVSSAEGVAASRAKNGRKRRHS